MSELRKKIEEAINYCSAENGSNTPDFILADYLADCLTSFDRAVEAREKWYGRDVLKKSVPPPTEAPEAWKWTWKCPDCGWCANGANKEQAIENLNKTKTIMTKSADVFVEPKKCTHENVALLTRFPG